MVEIKQIQDDIVRYVSGLLDTAKSTPGLNMHQKEVPLYLFYNLGAAITDTTFKLENWGKKSDGSAMGCARARHEQCALYA
jgi:hypothetical protein